MLQEKKNRKTPKKKRRTNTIAQVYDASSITDARDINMKHALVAATTTAASNDKDDDESSCCCPSPILNVFSFPLSSFRAKPRITFPLDWAHIRQKR
jgi:hypothetical protein